MSDRPIKEGDLVTVSLNEHSDVSNTYLVFKKLDGQSILSHPLAPECLIIKDDFELNQDFPSMQSQLEKSLTFAKKNRNELGYTMARDLDALCFYFVIRKEFTPKQRRDLSNICGKISSVILGNNVSAAVTTIKQNQALLDEYNHSLLNEIQKVLINPLALKTKNERYTLFNVSGFILAQLSQN
jgi:hypothetical protein